MSPDRVIVTTTTFYKDPRGKDKVRFELACELAKKAFKAGHIVVIVDGSPDLGVEGALVDQGAHVFKQIEPGMGPSRRQVWQEAGKFVDSNIAGILWTEPEKPDVIRSVPKMLSAMKKLNALVVILRRTEKTWETYPGFQRRTESIANLVYNNLFSNPNYQFDPMSGPVLIQPDALSRFVEFIPANWGLPDTYVQHYVPVLMRLRDLNVVSVDVDFVYPLAQKAEEEAGLSLEMQKKRLWQLEQLVEAYFTMRRLFRRDFL